MVDLPRVGSQRRALGLVCALAVFALIGHATSDTWGSNSTRTLQGSKLFKATTDLGQGTNVHVFGPLLNQALYGVAYNDASNNNKLWFLAISDFSAGTFRSSLLTPHLAIVSFSPQCRPLTYLVSNLFCRVATRLNPAWTRKSLPVVRSPVNLLTVTLASSSETSLPSLGDAGWLKRPSRLSFWIASPRYAHYTWIVGSTLSIGPSPLRLHSL